jgi:hypothetical protein
MVPTIELQIALPSESAGLWAVWTRNLCERCEHEVSVSGVNMKYLITCWIIELQMHYIFCGIFSSDLATFSHGVSRCRELFRIFSLLIQNNNKLNDPWHPTWPRRLKFKFHAQKHYIQKCEITFWVVIRVNRFGFNISGLNEKGRFWLKCENRN